MSSTAVPGPVGRPRGRRLSSVFKRQGVQAFLFISPAVLLLGVLIVYPMVRTSIYSYANLNSRLEVTRSNGIDNNTL
jgi:ABC-type sugar transport system permease subunit